jgi:hypothetical protein
MEKVVVVKEIPGMLHVGEVLVKEGGLAGDFIFEQKEENNERFVSIDYVTVSDNIPEYFDYVIESTRECQNCEECECVKKSPALLKRFCEVERDGYEIAERLSFYENHLEQATPGSEMEVVYQNLIWFIEWLNGKKQLLS